MLIRVSPRSMLAAHGGSVLRLPFHSGIGDRARRRIRRKPMLHRELGEALLFDVDSLQRCGTILDSQISCGDRFLTRQLHVIDHPCLHHLPVCPNSRSACIEGWSPAEELFAMQEFTTALWNAMSALRIVATLPFAAATATCLAPSDFVTVSSCVLLPE
jgi:hypothetical protein